MEEKSILLKCSTLHTKQEGGKALSKNNISSRNKLSETEKTQNMINWLRRYPPEKQRFLLVDYKLEWLGDISKECLADIDQRLDELK